MTDKTVKVHLFVSFYRKKRPFHPLNGKLKLSFEGAIHFETTLSDEALRPFLRCTQYSSELLKNPYHPPHKNRAAISLLRCRTEFSLRNIGYHLKLTVSGRYITDDEKGYCNRVYKKGTTTCTLRFFDELTNHDIITLTRLDKNRFDNDDGEGEDDENDADDQGNEGNDEGDGEDDDDYGDDDGDDYDRFGELANFLSSDRPFFDDPSNSDLRTLDFEIRFEGGLFHGNPGNKFGVQSPDLISFGEYFFYGSSNFEIQRLLAAFKTGRKPKSDEFEKPLTAMGFDEAMANLKDLWQFYKNQQWSKLQECHHNTVRNNLIKLRVLSEQLLEHLINPSLVTDAHINAPDLGQLIRRKLSQIMELPNAVENFLDSFPEVMDVNLPRLLIHYIRDLNRDFFDEQILKVHRRPPVQNNYLNPSYSPKLNFQMAVQKRVVSVIDFLLRVRGETDETDDYEIKEFYVSPRPTDDTQSEFLPSYPKDFLDTVAFDRYSVQEVPRSNTSVNVFENGCPSVIARLAVDGSGANVFDHYLIRHSKELIDLRQVFKLPSKPSKDSSGLSEINQKGIKKSKHSKLLYRDDYSKCFYKPHKGGGMVVRVCFGKNRWTVKFGFIDSLMNENHLQSFELSHVIGNEKNSQLQKLLYQEYCCKSHILCLAFSIKDESPDTRVLVAIRSSEDMDVPLLITWKVIRNDVVSLSLTPIEIKASSTTDEAVLGHDRGGRFMIHKGIIFDLYLISSLLYPACIVHCLHKGQFVPFGGLKKNPGFHHLIKQRSWVQQTTQPKYMWSSDVWALERSPKLYCHTESFDNKSGTRTYRKYSLRFKW